MFIFSTKGFYNFDSGMHEPTDFFKNAFPLWTNASGDIFFPFDHFARLEINSYIMIKYLLVA